MLPIYSIEADGAVTWKGESLRFGHLQEIVYALRGAKGFELRESIEVAKARWKEGLLLSVAILARLPSEKTLNDATPEIPERPRAPAKPRQTKFFRVANVSKTLDVEAYNAAKARWEREMEDYEVFSALYEATLDESRERAANWKKFGGERGIEKLQGFRRHFEEFVELFQRQLDRPEDVVGTLPFEILPPGLWNLPMLFSHLGNRQWRVQEIVPERLTHLFELNPIRVYQGEVHRLYREYLLFLYGENGPAVLETPFHGNASYVLHSNWFTLCQKSKADLVKDPEASRVIHYDMSSWRREICWILKKPMPKQSNEY